MTQTATATIEVLTAEVRVLMVGSRQVTLSVFRQLDHAPWHECEPFGRIRDSQNGYNEKTIIGKHRVTGQLVRADFGRQFGNRRPKWEMEAELLRAVNKVKENRQRIQEADSGGELSKWRLPNRSAYVTEMEASEKEVSVLEAEKASLPAIQQQFDKQLDSFNALPLIILAGLK